MAGNTWNETVPDEVDWISASGVLRYARIGVVDTAIFFQNNVFENSPEP